MPDVTRRGFLRSASIGAAMVGALSALPSLARAQAVSPMPMPMTPSSSPSPMSGMIPSMGSTTAPSTSVVVFFDDLSSGKGHVFIAEKAVDFDSPALAQSVLSILG